MKSKRKIKSFHDRILSDGLCIDKASLVNQNASQLKTCFGMYHRSAALCEAQITDDDTLHGRSSKKGARNILILKGSRRLFIDDKIDLGKLLKSADSL